MIFDDGPYIKVACFCESVIEGKDGVLSLIRVIDTITSTASGPEAPDSMPPLELNLKLVVMAVAGQALGRHELKLLPELPSGIREREREFVASVHFEGAGKGTNILVDYRYRFELEGLYWFDLLLDEQLWTRIPFYVRYNRITTGLLS